MQTRPILALVLGLLAAGPAGATPDPEPVGETLPPVRVHLASLGSPGRVTLRAAGPMRVSEASTGRVLDLREDLLTVTTRDGRIQAGSETVDGLRVEAGSLTVEIGRLSRTYSGALLLSPSRTGISVTNECDLEQYVEGVLACECPAGFQPEAIKAMAVATRSYSYRKAYLAQSELCDTTHCQVYRGSGGIPTSITEAVRATEGVFALYDGEVIDAVYSSDCGGYTAANEEAWKGTQPIPYLRSVEDAPSPKGEPYCAVNRGHTWSLHVPLSRLQALAGRAATQLKVDLLDLSPSGRVRQLLLSPLTSAAPAVAGATASVTALTKLFTGEQWRQVLGAAAVKSLKFEVKVTANGIELQGCGYGHGVGLCQFGANGMARQGSRFDQILRHYYTGITLGDAPDPDEARSRLLARRAARGRP